MEPVTELKRAAAAKLALAAGAARVGDTVSLTTDFLIVGGLGSKQWKEPGEKGSKLLAAEEHVKMGLADTKVLTEGEFLEIVHSSGVSLDGQ